MDTANDVMLALEAAVKPGKDAVLGRFFKTGPGQYGEGDVFIGVMVPEQRTIARRHIGLPLAELETLLASEVHEHRLTALLILVYAYGAASGDGAKRRIYFFYLAHTARINNWDLVDVTAPNIVGDWLLRAGPTARMATLSRLATSEDLWENRIAIVATLAFIRRGQLDDTFHLCERFLGHEHDLMHKACGWMLREAGKRDERALCAFLKAHKTRMPRTMLRYAIERFDESRRRAFMAT
ncbi:MAG: DNA alkylation repair protein [Acidobacteriota bacterium]